MKYKISSNFSKSLIKKTLTSAVIISLSLLSPLAAMAHESGEHSHAEAGHEAWGAEFFVGTWFAKTNKLVKTSSSNLIDRKFHHDAHPLVGAQGATSDSSGGGASGESRRSKRSARKLPMIAQFCVANIDGHANHSHGNSALKDSEGSTTSSENNSNENLILYGLMKNRKLTTEVPRLVELADLKYNSEDGSYTMTVWNLNQKEMTKSIKLHTDGEAAPEVMTMRITLADPDNLDLLNISFNGHDDQMYRMKKKNSIASASCNKLIERAKAEMEASATGHQ